MSDESNGTESVKGMNEKTILVVEDNPLNMTLMVKILSSSGYRVLKATPGEEGLEAARSNLPHLILMDIHLPKQNGYEITEILRSDPDTGHIPVVAVMASAREVDEIRALKSGCVAFLSKPIRLRKLLACVEKHIPRGFGCKAGAHRSNIPRAA